MDTLEKIKRIAFIVIKKLLIFVAAAAVGYLFCGLFLTEVCGLNTLGGVLFLGGMTGVTYALLLGDL